MSVTDILSKAQNSVLNRYVLSLTDCDFVMDVEDFSGHEGLSELYHYTIRFTSSNHDIQPQQVLRKSGTFTMRTLTETFAGMVQLPVTVKRVHGTVTAFRRITGSRDQVSYEIVLQSFLALLKHQYRTHRFFVNKSVPEVVEQILIHFGDTQAALIFDKKLAINSPSGMSDSGADSVWALSVAHNVVEKSVTTKDYNHRQAQMLLQSASADMTRGEGEGINYGEVYH